LASKGFLKRSSEKKFYEDGKPIPKPVSKYSLNKMKTLNIPKWEELTEFNKNTLDNKNTLNGLNTLDTQENKQNKVNLQEVQIDFKEVFK